jgi:solute carrier family 25 carnitine/acylcarnitine transporter 20/29
MQPFEKIKVMLQTQGPVKQYTGIIDCIQKVVKHEGFMGFYKGMLVPLMGIGLIGSVRFVVLENIKR